MDISDYIKPIFSLLRRKYNDTISRRGRIIKELIRIKRNEDEKSHQALFEHWDYSIDTIRELTRQGDQDADSVLGNREF